MVWNEETDVVVVGSGLAGLSAAVEACKANAGVIVFEKMKVTGGNTRISDGGLAAPGNFLQKKLAIEDSPERFYDDMWQAGLGLNHPELLRVVAGRASEAIEWTRTELGVRYLERLDRFGGHSVARGLTTRHHSGKDLIKALTARLRTLEVEIRTRWRLSEIITDPDGSVRGVRMQSGDQFPGKTGGVTKNIRAARAVVLATGGFARDVEFRKLQNPRLDASVGSTNHRGATAEGLIAALKIKAAPVHLSWIQTGPWSCADEPGYGKGARFASYSLYPGGILVDPATGCRIVNEWADRRARSEAIFKTGRVCVGIVDAEGAGTDQQSLEHCLQNGKVRQFEDLAALAAAYDMPAAALKATVEDYNRNIVENRPDPLGKPLEGGARPLSHPPYYALRLWPKVHYTPGGIGINARAQVISLQNQPIPRLYAAGEVCGGIHGASRLGSCALTECLVFGRIAGKQAASLEPR